VSEKDDGVPSGSADVPPTRPSRISIDEIVAFPDDSEVSRFARKVDDTLGVIEQAILFFVLALVTIVAAYATLHDKFFSSHVGRWWHYILRGGTFTLAMFGGAYATQQQKNLAMDLVSRRLSARSRLVLGVLLKLFVIAMAMLLFRAGLHLHKVAKGLESLTLGPIHITDPDVVATLPIAAALIMVHCLLHLTIDVDYLRRGKTLPERARSGH
jgi:TRAP-type C4-dicarboxylate transport system permease small subunit